MVQLAEQAAEELAGDGIDVRDRRPAHDVAARRGDDPRERREHRPARRRRRGQPALRLRGRHHRARRPGGVRRPQGARRGWSRRRTRPCRSARCSRTPTSRRRRRSPTPCARRRRRGSRRHERRRSRSWACPSGACPMTEGRARRAGSSTRAPRSPSATRSPRSRPRRSTASSSRPAAGVLRRRVAGEGDVDPGRRPARRDRGRRRCPTPTIDAFVAEFQATFVPGEAEEDAGPAARDGHGRQRARCASCARARAASRSCSCTASAATSTTGCSTPTPLAAEPRRLRARPAGPRRLDQGGRATATSTLLVGARAASSSTARASSARTSPGTRWAASSPPSSRSPTPTACCRSTLVAPAGLGARDQRASTSRGSSRRRGGAISSPCSQRLFADPALVTRQIVDDVLKYKRLDGVQGALETLPGSLFPDGRQTRVLAAELEDGYGGPVLVIWGERDAIIPRRARRGRAVARRDARPAGRRALAAHGGRRGRQPAARRVPGRRARRLSRRPMAPGAMSSQSRAGYSEGAHPSEQSRPHERPEEDVIP